MTDSMYHDGNRLLQDRVRQPARRNRDTIALDLLGGGQNDGDIDPTVVRGSCRARAGGHVMDEHPELRKYVPSLVWYRPFEPFAYAFIRFSVGAVLLLHGVQRLIYGAPLAELGPSLSRLPASAVISFEIVGGAMLAFGFLTRPVALLFALEWLTVSLSAHLKPEASWFMLGASEHFPALMTGLCIAFVMGGGGRYSRDRYIGKEF